MHMTPWPGRWAGHAALGLAAAAIAAQACAQAGSSVMIWPVDPIIEDGQRAAALWLENRSAHSVSLQLRVLGWAQNGNEENYETQERVVASPPLAVIPPGQRQLVRLMNTGPAAVPEGKEQPYRVLVDELPTPESEAAAAAAANSMGVKLQIRYSLPLFVYGKGLYPAHRAGRGRAAAGGGQPQLSWRLVREGGTDYLQLRNAGPVHARLTAVQWVRDGRAVVVNPGLLGYVLPHSEMRWPLREPAPAGHALQARVNASETPLDVPPQ